MKVIIIAKAGYTGRDGRTFACRDVADYDERLALKLIAHGIAVPAPRPPKIETAAKTPPQNTAKRIAKPDAPKAKAAETAAKGKG